jgi:hypothetical protein
VTRILRGIGSRTLDCGCLVGLYELYDGRTVAIIDARGHGCSTPEHEPHTELQDLPDPRPADGDRSGGRPNRES